MVVCDLTGRNILEVPTSRRNVFESGEIRINDFPIFVMGQGFVEITNPYGYILLRHSPLLSVEAAGD